MNGLVVERSDRSSSVALRPLLADSLSFGRRGLSTELKDLSVDADGLPLEGQGTGVDVEDLHFDR